MTDKIEAWCVVTEGDALAVRLVTLTRKPREYGGNAVCDLWEAEDGVRVQCTAETEAEARQWLAEEICMRLGHAAESVVRWEHEVAGAKECLDDARAELEEWQARAVAAGVSLEAIPTVEGSEVEAIRAALDGEAKPRDEAPECAEDDERQAEDVLRRVLGEVARV